MTISELDRGEQRKSSAASATTQMLPLVESGKKPRQHKLQRLLWYLDSYHFSCSISLHIQ